ncbi:apoptosis-resistant E3 ubiquitin protein ligase 1-like [Trichogramma pretiosum]|uniref:apoptosis-resistant E3 ubiquitin protein ligase 1-like n=1 Tax=Trichogramma pretiosum TaxID=7493 RepID=UPI0006C951AE|nr:apoptosis-resistant E3 ubiquitin protein ligase 1-like [Trichogramma pretiosum]
MEDLYFPFDEENNDWRSRRSSLGRRSTYGQRDSFASSEDLYRITSAMSIARQLATNTRLVVEESRWPTYPAASDHSDRYVYASDCKLLFDWERTQPVGQTVSFRVKFYQRNGLPHPICDMDNFNVRVSRGYTTVPTTIELGSTDPALVNQALVMFRSREAGTYSIEAKIGANHVRGSPCCKTFRALAADPKTTRFLRTGSILVLMKGANQVLEIDARDEFDNVCDYVGADKAKLKDFEVHVKQIENFSKLKNDEKKHEEQPQTSEQKPEQRRLRKSSMRKDVPGKPELAFDRTTRRVGLDVRFDEAGLYRLSIDLNGQQITNGECDILVLQESEFNEVRRNMSPKDSERPLRYEAKLLGWDGKRYARAKSVTCYITSKHLTIKKPLLRYFQTTVATFRLGPLTKIHFRSLVNSGSSRFRDHQIFTIDDGGQPLMELSSPQRYVIAATAISYQQAFIGGHESFAKKTDYFYGRVRKYHERHGREKVELTVERDRLLQTSFKATKSYLMNQWCGRFEIVFQGEPGIDRGGIGREWCELICAELFDPDNRPGLFAALSERAGLVHPTTHGGAPSGAKMPLYEFAGQIVGKCLYESAQVGTQRMLVRARFTHSFLAQLLGLRVDYRHFEHDDPEFYRSKIQYILNNDLDELEDELFFAEEVYGPDGKLDKLVELIPGGRSVRVTNETKIQYVQALAEHRLANKSIRAKVKAFLKGLTMLIPHDLLRIFSEKELELLMCGADEYSVQELRACHEANGYSPQFRRTLDWFWQALEGFSRDEMARLVQFVTGSSRLPVDGFKSLDPTFTIVDVGGYGHLPTAHTCVNQLCLPEYSCYEDLERALLYALKEGAEGFGLV